MGAGGGADFPGAPPSRPSGLRHPELQRLGEVSRNPENQQEETLATHLRERGVYEL